MKKEFVSVAVTKCLNKMEMRNRLVCTSIVELENHHEQRFDEVKKFLTIIFGLSRNVYFYFVWLRFIGRQIYLTC
jgi:hypothetical protein